jgi:hypothetical protein
MKKLNFNSKNDARKYVNRTETFTKTLLSLTFFFNIVNIKIYLLKWKEWNCASEIGATLTDVVLFFFEKKNITKSDIFFIRHTQWCIIIFSIII